MEQHTDSATNFGADATRSETTARSETTRTTTKTRLPRGHGERGEGVISTAIAVLIVAFLGIGLWTGFDSMMNSATDRTRAQVEQIGG